MLLNLFWMFCFINIVVVFVMAAMGTFSSTKAPKWCAILPTLLALTGPLATISLFCLIVQPETLKTVLSFLQDAVVASEGKRSSL